MRIVRIFREIKNYLFLLSVIRKHRRSPEWSKHKLRVSWFGTIGTVINLPPDVFQGEAIYYQMYVIEQMKPINRYLEGLNLQEIIYPRTKSLVDPSRGEYAYLVKYKPLFRDFTFWWLFSRTAIVTTIWYLQAKFEVFTRIWNWGAEMVGNLLG